MDREEPRHKERDRQPHGPARLALRAIDGGIRALQRLRNRFEPPVEEAEDDRRGRKRPAEETPPPVAAAPGRPTLLHRLLVTAMCLLLGGAAGSWFSYHLLSGLIEARGTANEAMQEALDQARKAEAVSAKTQERCNRKNVDYWKQIKEAERTAEDAAGRIEALEKQVAELEAARRPPSPTGRAAAGAAPARPPLRQKTGSCVTGSANAGGNLAECIEKFNRP